MADLNGGVVGVDNPVVTQAQQITTFNSSGTLTTQPLTSEIEFLVVAGGGGSGGAADFVDAGSGGGGAGGFRTATGNPVSGGAPYPVTVGGGGAGANPNSQGGSGSNSVLGTPTTPPLRSAMIRPQSIQY